MKKITIEIIRKYRNHLMNEEKSQATISKYIRDITVFYKRTGGGIDKKTVLAYKEHLIPYMRREASIRFYPRSTVFLTISVGLNARSRR